MGRNIMFIDGKTQYYDINFPQLINRVIEIKIPTDILVENDQIILKLL